MQLLFFYTFHILHFISLCNESPLTYAWKYIIHYIIHHHGIIICCIAYSRNRGCLLLFWLVSFVKKKQDSQYRREKEIKT